MKIYKFKKVSCIWFGNVEFWADNKEKQKISHLLPAFSNLQYTYTIYLRLIYIVYFKPIVEYDFENWREFTKKTWKSIFFILTEIDSESFDRSIIFDSQLKHAVNGWKLPSQKSVSVHPYNREFIYIHQLSNKRVWKLHKSEIVQLYISILISWKSAHLSNSM
jgi:hypothetical protein